MSAASPIHAVFASAPDAKTLSATPIPAGGRVSRYRVDSYQPIAGKFEAAPAAGWSLIRLEADHQAEVTAPMILRGVTGHLEYTATKQAAALASRPEFPPEAKDIRAVIIPIRKDAAWWAQAHDQRQVHFSEASPVKNHSAIGQPYTANIARKLYHSRYLGEKPGYDFVTYFEFEPKDEGVFRDLVAKLRDRKANPEWAHVDLEFEIWMTKLGA